MDLVTGLARARRGIMIFSIAAGLVALAGFGYLETQVRSLTAHINTLRAEAASAAANRPVMVMTIADAQSVIDEASQDIDRACRFAEAARKSAQVRQADPDHADAYLNLVWNVCPSTPGSARPALAKFQSVYFKAAAARLSGHYDVAAPLYRQAVDLGAGLPNEWTVRAAEGLAYSELRLGKLAEAGRDAGQARSLAPSGKNFVFADTTALKVMCRNKPSNPVEIRAALDQARSDFDKMVAASTGRAQCFAKLDRKTIEDDQELFADCAAAGVRPMTVSAPASCDDASAR